MKTKNLYCNAVCLVFVFPAVEIVMFQRGRDAESLVLVLVYGLVSLVWSLSWSEKFGIVHITAKF